MNPSETLRNEELPPLFWDALPDNAEENPTYAALQAIEDEATPLERAQTFKEQGNNKLRVGIKAGNKILYRDAIQFYTQGLQTGCTDTELLSVLHANRAQVELMLGNWRKALNDSKDAVNLNPTNVKAYFRGAKSALQLHEFDIAKKLCMDGLAVDASAKELTDLQESIAAKQAAAQKKREQEQQRLHARIEPAKELADAIQRAGYRMTQAQFRAGHRKPYIGKDGILHWPVLLTYAENMQQDVIEDFDAAATFADHLDVMFGPDAPPLEWDERQEYTRKSVEVYYLSNAGRQLSKEELITTLAGEDPSDAAPEVEMPCNFGSQAAAWVKVDELNTLHEVLTKADFVIPGVPVFFVVAKGTGYRDRFLKHK